MKKTWLIIIFLVITIAISSAQMLFLNDFNRKIQILESNQQVIGKIAEEHTLSFKDLNNRVGDITANVHNLGVVIDRSLGKYIEIKPPPTFVAKIKEFDNKLNNTITLTELMTIEDDFNELVKNTQKWVLDEFYSELSDLSTRMKLRHLLLQAESDLNVQNIESLLESYENLRLNLSKNEFQFYQKKIDELVEQHQENTKQEAIKEIQNIAAVYDELKTSKTSTLSKYNELLEKLENYANFEPAEELMDDIEKQVRLISLNKEIDRIKMTLDNAPESEPETTLELLSQCSSDSMKLYQDVLQTENSILIKKHNNIMSQIENEIASTNLKINQKMNRKINNYNLWALDSILSFKNRMIQTKSKMGMFGEIEKEIGLGMVYDDLEENLLVIDQNLLLDPVREIYTQAYVDARSILENEKYLLEISKASASIERKTLSDTENYAITRKLSANSN